ncbi:hypothetical protein TcWFU_006217 [Taenia crassiceps]|uniref:Uncharacterized protein n=1 Tax=Taenia crassiceps TaxID=6207 RepID=A0ABR4Q3H2_9CEST
MRFLPFKCILLILALLAVSSNSENFFTDSLLDCATSELLEYVKSNGNNFHVKHIDNLVRSCPLSWHTVTRNGTSTYTILVCFNVTRLELAPPTGMARKVKIGYAKVILSVTIKRGEKTEVKVGMATPVFNNAYVYIFGIPIPASVNAISAHSISAYAHTTPHSDEVGSPPLHRTIALSPHRRRHSRGALRATLASRATSTNTHMSPCAASLTIGPFIYQEERHERIAEGIAIEGTLLATHISSTFFLLESLSLPMHPVNEQAKHTG